MTYGQSDQSTPTEIMRYKPQLVFGLALLGQALFMPSLQLAAETPTETVDTSILEEKNSLFSLLSPSQRLEYVRAEEQVESGASDLRRGEYMANRQPSGLNPDEDLTEVKARGQRLIEEGRKKIREGEAKMVALLQGAKAEQAASALPEKERYSHVVEVSTSYTSALEAAASVLLKTCWDAGYDQIFLDRIFRSNAEGTEKTETSVNNLTYDSLIEIDGTRFTVNLPVNLSPDLKTPGSGRQFTFNDLDTFSGERIALLSIELIEFDTDAGEKTEPDASNNPEPEADAPEVAATESESDTDDPSATNKAEEPAPPVQLLVVQGLDIDTLQVIHQELRWIVPEGATAPEAIVKDEFALIERKQTIQRLASLPGPYQFRIESALDDPTRAMMLEAYLRGALIEHFALQLVPARVLRRTYAAAGDDKFEGLANARFVLQPDKNDASRFGLSATADGTDRRLPLGWIELSGEY